MSGSALPPTPGKYASMQAVVQVEVKDTEFNAEFLVSMMPKLRYDALWQAAKQVIRIPGIGATNRVQSVLRGCSLTWHRRCQSIFRTAGNRMKSY